MVFGLQKLQDSLFCVTEERDYFQGKYLEQVSEIKALKEQLKNARREIRKLRGELMAGSISKADDDEESSKHMSTPPSATASVTSKNRMKQIQGVSPLSNEEHANLCQKYGEDEQPENLNNQEDQESDRESDCEEEEEEDDIRQNAAKLLHWADYRTSASSSRLLRSTNKSSTCDTSTSPSTTSGPQNNDETLDVYEDSSKDIPRTIPSEDDSSKRFPDDTSDLGDSEDHLYEHERPTKRNLVDRFEELVTSL